MEILSKSVAETKRVAEIAIETILARKEQGTATVVALLGDLGAGKTTFVQKCGEVLGIPDLMQSPTFVIERRYPIDAHPFTTLIHIDAYRIEDPKELSVLKFADDLENPNNLIFIEWADRVAPLLPQDTVRIQFSHEGLDQRGIHITDFQ